MTPNSQNSKKIPLSIVSMNKMSKNLYARSCPTGVYDAPTSYEGVLDNVKSYRTSYDKQLNNKYCYFCENTAPKRYQS